MRHHLKLKLISRKVYCKQNTQVSRLIYASKTRPAFKIKNHNNNNNKSSRSVKTTMSQVDGHHERVVFSRQKLFGIVISTYNAASRFCLDK